MSQTSAFRALHQQPDRPLILPNVWDVGSAKIVESLGAKAVATTSAGVAWSLGWQDGNRLPVERQARLAADLVQAVGVPVTMDVEAGYSQEASVVGENIRAFLDAGIAGINIEDGNDEPAVLAKKIEAIKRVAAATGADLFVNARTDVFLQNLVADEKKVAETLQRAAMYEAAGADGLFVPGLADAAQIRVITGGTELPVNVLAWSGLPKVSELAKLGARRLSAGAGIPQVIWQHVAQLTEAFLKDGDSAVFEKDAMSGGKLQGLFAGRG